QAITREEASLRAHLAALDAHTALVEAFAAHLTEAQHLLEQLQARVEEVDDSNDVATKRAVVELLVRGIQIDTLPDRTLVVTIDYTFTPARVATHGTGRRSGTLSCPVALAHPYV